jgi:glycosyltransferase involved in cell wall biosynthesis
MTSPSPISLHPTNSVPSYGTVTIVVPTYNRRELLLRAVNSICSQTYSDIRILVCDNASTDGTEELLAELMELDRRINYFRQKNNLGMSANVNFGLKSIETPFFGILSDDDYFLPHFIERAMHPFGAYPMIKLSLMDGPAMTESGEFICSQLQPWPKEGLYAPGEAIKIAAAGYHPILTAGLYRSDLLTDFSYDPELGSVADIPVLLLLLAKHPAYVSKEVGLHFIRHGAAAGEGTSGALRSAIKAYILVEKRLAAADLPAPIRAPLLASFGRYINRLFLAWLVHSLGRRDRSLAIEIYGFLKCRQAVFPKAVGAAFLGISSLGGSPVISQLLKLRARLRARQRFLQ